MTSDNFNARVLIRRNADGQIVECTDLDAITNTSIYQWTDGNFSCDCNRHIFFEGEYDEYVSCGEDKYAIQLYNADTGELLVDEFESRN